MGNRQDFILTYASRLQISYEKTPNKLFTHRLFFGLLKKPHRCSFLNFSNCYHCTDTIKHYLNRKKCFYIFSEPHIYILKRLRATNLPVIS